MPFVGSQITTTRQTPSVTTMTNKHLVVRFKNSTHLQVTSLIFIVVTAGALQSIKRILRILRIKRERDL